MKKVLTIFLFLASVLPSWGQQIPVFSQHFLNPYLYNPAFAGIDGAFSAFLTYRNQWVGIEGSPVTANLSFHMPLPNQILVGASIYSDKRGLLNNTTGLASFGYLLPLGDDQSLRFGLSAGIGSQKLDLESVANINDPALLNAMDNSSYLAGNFGVVFEREELRLGFGLPRIFDNNVISESSFQDINFNPLSAYNVSARYKHHFNNGNLALEPIILYRGEENVSGQLDIAALVYYENLVWLGGSYRLDYGPTLLMGLNIMEMLHVGYAYEFATDQVSGIGNGSHEIQLKFSLAKDKVEKTKKEDVFIHDMAERRALAQAQRDSVAAAEKQKQEVPPVAPVVVLAITETTQEPDVQTEPSAAEPTPAVTQPEISPPAGARPRLEKEGARPRLDQHRAMEFNAIIIDHRDEVVRVTRGEHLFELHHGYFVVVAAFYTTADAVAYSDHLFSDFNLETQYGYVTDTQHWYVYEFHSADSHEAAIEARDKARDVPAYHDAWILVVE